MTFRIPALRFNLKPSGDYVEVHLTRTVPVRETELLSMTRRRNLDEARNGLADLLFELQQEVGEELDIKDYSRLATMPLCLGAAGGAGHDHDSLVWWLGRLRPVAMGVALERELAHLALDHPRQAAQPA